MQLACLLVVTAVSGLFKFAAQAAGDVHATITAHVSACDSQQPGHHSHTKVDEDAGRSGQFEVLAQSLKEADQAARVRDGDREPAHAHGAAEEGPQPQQTPEKRLQRISVGFLRPLNEFRLVLKRFTITSKGCDDALETFKTAVAEPMHDLEGLGKAGQQAKEKQEQKMCDTYRKCQAFAQELAGPARRQLRLEAAPAKTCPYPCEPRDGECYQVGKDGKISQYSSFLGRYTVPCKKWTLRG